MTQPRENSSPKADRDGSAKPREIEAEIGQTRDAITGDIRALGDKLSPAHLKQEAKDALHDAKDAAVNKARDYKDAAVEKVRDVSSAAAETVTDTAHQVSEQLEVAGDAALRAGDATWRFVRANAVPLSLMGLGAGLLIANTRSSRTTVSYESPELYTEYDPAEPYEWSAADSATSNKRRPVRARARRMAERAQDTAHLATERAADATRRTRDLASERLQSLRDGSEALVHEHPLAVGAALLAVGIGIGALLPRDSVLGETRDRLVSEARSAARKVGDTARETAKSLS